MQKSLGNTLGVDEVGDHCDKAEMVLIVAYCCGGLGEDKGTIPMSEEFLRSPTPTLS